MRVIDYIAVHCSATPEGKHFTAKDINNWHKQRGWSGIGYHYVVLLDGTVEKGRPIDQPGAHVYGYNQNSIGITYIGGVDENGDPKDTRTCKQKEALRELIEDLLNDYPLAIVMGHRDFSPDIDGDGIIEPFEWLKACPSFDAKFEYMNITPKITTDIPFKTIDQGNKFRRWVNDTFSHVAKRLDLDRWGAYNNSYIRAAWRELGEDYVKSI